MHIFKLHIRFEWQGLVEQTEFPPQSLLGKHAANLPELDEYNYKKSRCNESASMLNEKQHLDGGVH